MSDQINNAGASVIMFGLHRGGTSIIAKLLEQVLGAAGYRLIDESRRYYEAGYADADMPHEFFDTLAPFGTFYGPFRSYPLAMRQANLAGLTRIVIARDPRDCLVSAYFAQHGPHDRGDVRRAITKLPTHLDTPEPIDRFCIRNAEPFQTTMRSLRLLSLQYPDTLIYRYEDIFLDPAGWLIALVGKLKLMVPPEALDQALIDAVFDAGGEHPERHHRQGHPGDHHLKLLRATSLHLTELFAADLAYFGYGGAVAQPVTWVRRARATAQAAGDFAELESVKRIVQELQRENGFRINEIAALRQDLTALSDALAATHAPMPPPRPAAASNGAAHQ